MVVNSITFCLSDYPRIINLRHKPASKPNANYKVQMCVLKLPRRIEIKREDDEDEQNKKQIL